MKKTDFKTPPEALFRYQVISQVLSKVAAGKVLPEAVRETAGIHHFCPEYEPRKVSRRSIYRWLKAYREQGFDGLLPKSRKQTRGSEVLAPDLLAFFVRQKKADPLASIPELINRSLILGKIQSRDDVSRVTVWRALNRMGIDTSPRKSKKNRDSRRFAYPHRMDMVLCDGKHFRAGENRRKRVAFFFLDDCSRMVLNVVVGTSENTKLFMRGLYETIKTYGFMTALFVDRGSAFKSHDAVDVLRKLDILLIHGAKGYPQGRGKIERFNRTASEQAIRYFNGNPEINPDCLSLERRLRHYINNRYAHSPHEKLEKQTPWNCFQNDPKPLRFAENIDQLRRHFVLYIERRVSFDNIVSLKGTDYEVPRGYAGTHILIRRNVLNDNLSVHHQERWVRIFPVDLHSNARDGRAGNNLDEQEAPDALPPKSCSQIAYDRDFQPVVDADGGFPNNPKKKGKS